MPTLAGIDGRSLVPNIGGQIAQGLDIRGEMQRQKLLGQQVDMQNQQAQQAQAAEARRRQLLGLPPLGQVNPQLGGIVQQQPEFKVPAGATPGIIPQYSTANQRQLVIEFPEYALKQAEANKAIFENQGARDKARIESVVTGAAEALASPNPLATLKARRDQLVARGVPTDETDEGIAMFESGDIEGGTNALKELVSLGNQLGILEQMKTDVLSPEALAQKQAIASAGRTSVTVGGKAESKEREEIAQVRGRQFEKLLEAGENAETMIESLNNLDAIDASTGALEPAKASIAAVAEGFGIDASGIADIDTAQAFNAASNRLVNNVLNMAKGPQTEGDAQRAKTTIANLGDSPLAAQFKTDSLRAVALRTIEQRDFIESRVDEGQTFSQARKEWNDYTRETPSLSAVVKNPQTGLPVYYYQFKEMARKRRPGISDTEIIEAWRNANAK